ncbi:peptidase inhibitor I78 family protein [Sphingomonas sp. PP-F2F-A104-K0414]|uniref:I78 family peptidase inhibitor n=1 Tax=Sphingomonas sp. PP-F2F-A104-K0414 TaxID=2135661 RepID=UPI00104D42E8|nr:I78 family peptidase inhibitor [Sphingomonas sp. PP-F2F-A104-K0414]TCQ00730.1 peptidase inhibitor I78 family protein [Sphingomonas sp. PP-F2F-A104-K0414]
MRIVLVAALAATAACTPVEMRGQTPAAAPVATACNAASLGDLVGKRASDARADVMQTRSGSRTLRWIAPNTAVTMDFRADRLNVYVDAKGRIERFTCA